MAGSEWTSWGLSGAGHELALAPLRLRGLAATHPRAQPATPLAARAIRATRCGPGYPCHAVPSNAPTGLQVLNLFGYTGGSSLACLASRNADVTHLDGARAAVSRARSNAELSGLSGEPVRWIVDDALTYVRRAARRGERYDGIVLDPPAFGRGAKREWRIDRDLPLLSGLLAEVLSDDPSFVLLSAHDPRWPVAALDGQLREITRGASAVRGRCERGEMLLRARGGGRDLPMGVYSRWAAGTV